MLIARLAPSLSCPRLVPFGGANTSSMIHPPSGAWEKSAHFLRFYCNCNTTISSCYYYLPQTTTIAIPLFSSSPPVASLTYLERSVQRGTTLSDDDKVSQKPRSPPHARSCLPTVCCGVATDGVGNISSWVSRMLLLLLLVGQRTGMGKAPQISTTIASLSDGVNVGKSGAHNALA